jgi:hypothetical protein
MAQQIILNGTVANDGTGDNLRVTATKINANFTELYGRLNGISTSTGGGVAIQPAGSNTLTAGTSGTGATTVGSSGSGATNLGSSGTGASTFGGTNPASTAQNTFGGNGLGNNSFGGTNPASTGNNSFGGAGSGNNSFGSKGSGNSEFGSNGNGSSNFGGQGTGANSFGGNGSNSFGGNGANTFGKAGGSNTFITSEDPWQVLYSNASGAIDSSQWLKVSADSADTQGKSLHLAASTYDLGYGNSVNQRPIYFTNPTLAGGDATAYPSKRVASIRYYEQGASKGLFLTPNYNYNDTAFPDKGVGIWRHSDNGLLHTKVNLNAVCDGPGTHGVQIGRGAIGFFQDLPSYAIPLQRPDAVKGLTYIVLPGIHTDDGSCYVGQISGNPYKNRDPAYTETKGIPYWSLGHKTSTQLIENAPAGGIEKSERTPGTEVFVWTAQNRVGINNTNPQYDLDVTGSVNLTGQFLVDASAGTEGQVLTSHGASSSPTWAAVSVSTATNLSGGGTGSIPYQSAAGTTAMLAAGTNGQVLKMGGSGVPVWGTDAGGLSITNESSANTNYNLTMTTASSGSITSEVVDNGKLYYNPSEQRLYAPNMTVGMATNSESYFRFKDNGTGVNQAMLNAYSNFGGSGRGYFEVYVYDGSNEQGNNLNFNGYGAFGFDDNFGNQGDVVVSYGSTSKARIARIGTGTAQLVSQLPAANTAGAGARGFVTDATASTFYSVVAGGGSIGVPVFSDGTNWRIG